jgi:hypothetical protein
MISRWPPKWGRGTVEIQPEEECLDFFLTESRVTH